MIRLACPEVRSFLGWGPFSANTEKFLGEWGWLVTLISTAYINNLRPHLRATWGDNSIWTCLYSRFLRILASTIPTCQNSEWFTPGQDIWSCHRGHAHQKHNPKTHHSKPYSCEENLDSVSVPASPRPWLHFLLHFAQFSCFLQICTLNDLASEPVLLGPTVGGGWVCTWFCLWASE